MNPFEFRIKQLQNQLTATDKIIASYILSEPQTVLAYPSEHLAELTKTSASAWNRFAKKLGYKGITALKVELAKTNGKSEEPEPIDIVIDDSDTLTTIIQKEQQLYQRSIETTVSLIEPEVLEEAIDVIYQSQKIYIYGVGGSSIICRDFIQKINRIGFQPIYREDIHTLIAELAYMDKDDVFVAISYSGETPEVLFCAQLAKEKGAKVITITGFQKDSSLVKLSSFPLFVPLVEKEMRIGAIMSRNASLLVTDLLYLGLASKNIEDTRSRLIYTHHLANLLKQRKKSKEK